MAEIESLRKDFVIYVADDEESIQTVMKEALGDAGYQVETFGNGEDCLARLKEAPPHMVFSDIRMPGISGIQLLKEVKQLSRDIEFVIMTSHASMETAVEAIKAGAYDYIFKPFDSISSIVTSADRTIERVYLRLENEQLLEELAEKNKLLATVNQRISQENQEIHIVNGFMAKLAQVFEPDHVVQQLLTSISETIGGRPALYFKYMSQYSSLVAGISTKIPPAQIKGLGISLNHLDATKIHEALANPSGISQISDLMKEVFQLENYEVIPFSQKGNPLGIIVAFDKFNDGTRKLVDSFIQIANVSFDNAIMTQKMKEMAIKDPLTGLYNRRFFNERLEEELIRSRRTHYPLSLIYLDIDNFKHYNDNNGHPMGDVIIRSVAQILQKTSRKNDIVARLGGEEFGIICPHTARDGAAVKAEKVRLTVERTKFPHGEKQPLGMVSVSLGVSEYPTTVSDSEALVRMADDALYQVKQSGRNRVCMAQAPSGFKPDFEPLVVPSGPQLAKAGSGE